MLPRLHVYSHEKILELHEEEAMSALVSKM
jgi:hypothetical protein